MLLEKIKRSVLCTILAILVLPFYTFAGEPVDERQGAADKLYELGLFRGTDKGYELEKGLTRAEAITMVVRFVGAEQSAKDGNYIHPFADVPEWASPYVGYAYVKSLTKGVSSVSFAPDSLVTRQQFLTFMLRLLGYSDSEGDFVWDAPEALAKATGILPEQAAGEFNRGEMVLICLRVLEAKYKGTDQKVYEALIGNGVFTVEKYGLVMNGQTTSEKEDTSGTTYSGFAGKSRNTGSAGGDGNKEGSSENENAGEETPDKPSDVPTGKIKAVSNGLEEGANLFIMTPDTPEEGTLSVTLSLDGDVALCGFDITLRYDKDILFLESYETEYDLPIVAADDPKSGTLSFNFGAASNTTKPKKLLTAHFRCVGKAGETGKITLLAEEVIMTDPQNGLDIVPAPYALTSIDCSVE